MWFLGSLEKDVLALALFGDKRILRIKLDTLSPKLFSLYCWLLLEYCIYCVHRVFHFRTWKYSLACSDGRNEQCSCFKDEKKEPPETHSEEEKKKDREKSHSEIWPLHWNTQSTECSGGRVKIRSVCLLDHKQRIRCKWNTCKGTAPFETQEM